MGKKAASSIFYDFFQFFLLFFSFFHLSFFFSKKIGRETSAGSAGNWSRAAESPATLETDACAVSAGTFADLALLEPCLLTLSSKSARASTIVSSMDVCSSGARSPACATTCVVRLESESRTRQI